MALKLGFLLPKTAHNTDHIYRAQAADKPESNEITQRQLSVAIPDS
jgi:hypothetical protein